MLKIESLSKAFNAKNVIENLNFEVQKNETIALLGPNGSGKSTLLNMIAGILQPDSGNIYVDNSLVYGVRGVRKVDVKPSERKVGYVFQKFALFPHMRVQDNISYGLRALHLSNSEVKRRTGKLLEFVNLTEHALVYPNQLSGGQQQLVALARSLATEPQIILLDEPVSAIDPQLRETFRLELKKYLRTLEATTLYVTHNLNEAAIMADKIAIIGNGHIEQVGSSAEIFDKPQSRFVAKFLGTNIIEGKIIKKQNDHILVEIDNNTIITVTPDMDMSEKNVVITIKPEDVIITAEKNVKPNTINSIPGIITEMTQMRSNTQITINAGFSIKAIMTSAAIKNLGVTIGDKVYVTFNPSEVNVFRENLITRN